MPFDETSLAKAHNLLSYSIHSSTKIATRATSIITTLSAPPPQNEKPAIVVLRAGAKTASKAISITEIAKRELHSQGCALFQYTALSSESIEIDRVPKGRAVPASAGEREGEESDDAFQPCGTEGEAGRKKQREVPVLTVYLSAQSVKELRNAYGEQKT